MPIATITSKGQVTIPKDVRERLHLKAGDQVDFEVAQDGVVRMTAVDCDIRQLRGILRKRGRRAVSLEEMERAIQQRGKP